MADLPPKRVLMPRMPDGVVATGSSLSTLRRMEREGVLTPIRLRPNGKVYYAVEEIEALAKKEK
jgi:hypothetical protein